MKRLILIISLLAISFGLTHSFACADDAVTLTATASSTYANNINYYGPQKALDGLYNTYWLGERYRSPWWIIFDAGSEMNIQYLLITWYSDYYKPYTYNIEVSSDLITWRETIANTSGIYNANGTRRDIMSKARYIRFNIINAAYFPVLREMVAYAGVELPQSMRFQGVLRNSVGEPLTGPVNLRFRLYDVEAGGSALWEERQSEVLIERGLLDVELGSVTPFGLPFDKQYWLGIEVEPDGEMAPRFKLTTAPYSFRSVR